MIEEKQTNSKGESSNNGADTTIDFLSFSIFHRPITNTKPFGIVTIPEVYRLIKGEKYREITEALRNIPDVEQARKYKAANFDYVTFPGVFSKRGDAYLQQPSGLIAFDFDHVSDLQHLKRTLLNNPYFETELMFVSPSGDGLKWVIHVDLTNFSHLDWFNAVSIYLKMVYGLEPDQSGKDLSRACFLPYDPEAYIHPVYWEKD